MTSVGYGDKAPKSVLARLFSFVWIIIGITVFSLITATLTSEIHEANSQPPPTMEGARVGAMRYHLYEAMVVSSKGGVIVDVDAFNITQGTNPCFHLKKTPKNRIHKLRLSEISKASNASQDPNGRKRVSKISFSYVKEFLTK